MSSVEATAGDVLVVTRDNVIEAARQLPFLLRSLVRQVARLERGHLVVHLPGGRTVAFAGREDGPAGEVTIHSWRFIRRLVTRGDVGVGEAFMAGEWSSPDPTAMLEVFAVNVDVLADQTMPSGIAEKLLALQHLLNRNTRRGARRNIAAHYDLGNAFYESWLDPTMTYSSALYARGANDLETAQRDKYRALAERTGICPGDRVLEIGCGWGGFAEFAARDLGCRVTAITISAEQKAYAEERIRRQGLSDRVAVELRDYRDVGGTFDRIVSIEMFEAVGERYWPDFFRVVRDRLAPGGRAGLQIITIRDDLFDNYRRSADFIQKYIFPGGMLPPVERLRSLAAETGLSTACVEGFGRDYARTLAEWRERFLAAWPKLPARGFDERFRRMWLFYLHVCEAGFRAGTIDVKHVVLAKG